MEPDHSGELHEHTPEKFVFSWQEHGDEHQEFLRAIFPSMTAPVIAGGKETYAKLREVTKNWTEIEVAIQINGYAIPAESFIRHMRMVAESAGRSEVSRFLESSKKARRLEAVQDRMADVLSYAERELKAEFPDFEFERDW